MEFLDQTIIYFDCTIQSLLNWKQQHRKLIYTVSGEKENQEMTLKMTLWIKVLAAHALRPEFNSQNLGKGERKE